MIKFINETQLTDFSIYISFLIIRYIKRGKIHNLSFYKFIVHFNFIKSHYNTFHIVKLYIFKEVYTFYNSFSLVIQFFFYL